MVSANAGLMIRANEIGHDSLRKKRLYLWVAIGYTTRMKDPNQPKSDDKPAHFAAFDELARKLMGVPKSELDKREAEYQHQQAKKPKRGPKPDDSKSQ